MHRSRRRLSSRRKSSPRRKSIVRPSIERRSIVGKSARQPSIIGGAPCGNRTRRGVTRRRSQAATARPRGAAPALKNILSQLTGLASASPWHKQRDKRGAARKPKALRIEGLERREMLTVQGDIDVTFADPKFGSRIGPALFPISTASIHSPLFIVGESLPSSGWTSSTTKEFDVHFSVESDMIYGKDYKFYARDIVGSGLKEIDTANGFYHTASAAGVFEIEFLRSLEANEEHYVRVTLLDTSDYDVPNSAGYNADISFSNEFTNGETWYNLESRTAYFRGASTINQVAPCVECQEQCQAPDDTKALVNEGAGAAVVKHTLGGLPAGDGSDPSASPNGVLSYNSASLTSPTIRGYDFLLGQHSFNGNLVHGEPDSVEVTAQYYQPSGESYVAVSGATATSFFTTNYSGAQFGVNHPVQYALTPNASTLSTGVYKWQMSVKYHWADGTIEERAQPIEGYQLILNDTVSVFGKGWQFSEAPNLAVQNGGKIVTLREGQNAHTFFHTGGNNFSNGVGISADASLEGNTTNGFTYTDKNGTAWACYVNGRMFKSTDRNGNTTQYHYASGGAGQLEYIAYPNGRRTIFEYDGNYVSRIIEGALDDGSGGTSTWLDVDSSGLLQSITGEDADGDSTGLPAPFTEFNYVGSTALVEEVRRQIVSPLTPSETTNFEETAYTYHTPSGTVSAVNHTSGSCGCGAATMSFNAAQRWGASPRSALRRVSRRTFTTTSSAAYRLPPRLASRRARSGTTSSAASTPRSSTINGLRSTLTR